MRKMEVKIEVVKMISERDIKIALSSASTVMICWSKSADYRLRDDLSISDFFLGGKMQDIDDLWHWTVLVPLQEGCALVLELREETRCWDGQVRDRVELDLAALRRGAQTMADKYPERFTELFDHGWDGGDGVSADLFVQCCLFGELVYS